MAEARRSAMAADLVIRGGTLVDGTGAPGKRADVAIEDGRVKALGQNLDGDITLDAGEHIVAPGFIDLHTHYDAQVFWDPALTPSCFHGVTTVVAGNCGFSIAPTRPEHHEIIARTLENVEDMNFDTLSTGIPWDFSTFAEYLESVERRGLEMNFCSYIGHTAVRLFVMGRDAYERTATGDEIARMQTVVRDGLRAGAIGFSTSFAPTHRGLDGKPIPSRLADRAELESLLDVVRELDAGIVGVAPGDGCSDADLYELQLRTGRPFTYGAILTRPDGLHAGAIALNDEGWRRGAQVWPQVTPRPLVLANTMVRPYILNMNPVFNELTTQPLSTRRAAYTDPAWRGRALAGFESVGFNDLPWSKYLVDCSPTHPDLEGRSLADLAAERGVEPFDLMLDLALDEPSLELRILLTLANDDTAEVGKLLRDEHCTIGLSDAGAHLGQLCDALQATDFLGNWVRERSLMPVEAAVRKLTGVQADILGFADRGYLRPGDWADVVVFDPETIAPGPTRRVRDFPANSERLTADAPVGIRHVLVNGVPVQKDSTRLSPGACPGQLLRNHLARP
jgi:N-acyl-D-amino-acid deacylase